MHALKCTVPTSISIGRSHKPLDNTRYAPPTPSSTFRPLSKQKRKYDQVKDPSESDGEFTASPTKRHITTNTPSLSKSYAVLLRPFQSAHEQVHTRSVLPPKFQPRPLTPPTTPSTRKTCVSSTQDTLGRYRGDGSATLRNGPPSNPGRHDTAVKSDATQAVYSQHHTSPSRSELRGSSFSSRSTYLVS